MAQAYTITELKQLLRYRTNISTIRTDGDNDEVDTLIESSVRSLASLVSRHGGGKRLTFKVGLALRALGNVDAADDEKLPIAYGLGDYDAGHVGPHDVSGSTSIWQHRHRTGGMVAAPPFMRLVKIDMVENGWSEGEGLAEFVDGTFAAGAKAAALAAWSGEHTELKPSSMESFGEENAPEQWSASNAPTYRLVGGDGLLFDPPPSTLSFVVVWYEGTPVFQDSAGTTTLLLEPAWFDWIVGDVGSKLVSRQADRELYQVLASEKAQAEQSISDADADEDENHAGGIRRLYDYGRGRFSGDWEPTA